MTARGILATTLAVVPWLAFLPITPPVARVILGLAALFGACHGWGYAIAYVVDDRGPGWSLRIAWGFAFVGALLAAADAVGADPAIAARAIVAAGLVLHVSLLVRDRQPLRGVAAPGAGAIAVLVAFVIVALLQVLAAADAAPRLGLAELARLDAGLGVWVAFTLIVAVGGLRGGASAVWLFFVALLVSVLQPGWSIVALLLGAYATLALRPPDRGRPARRMLPLGLLAGGLAAIHVALIPVALALVGSVVLLEWRPAQRTAALGLGVLGIAIAVVPAALAGAVLAPPAHVTLARVIAGVTCLAITPVLALAVRDRRPGSPLYIVIAAISAGVAAVASGIAVGGGVAVPLLVALAAIVVCELARMPGPPLAHDAVPLRGAVSFHRAGYLIILVAVCMAVFAQRGSRRSGWAERYARMFAQIEHLVHRAGDSGDSGDAEPRE